MCLSAEHSTLAGALSMAERHLALSSGAQHTSPDSGQLCTSNSKNCPLILSAIFPFECSVSTHPYETLYFALKPPNYPRLFVLCDCISRVRYQLVNFMSSKNLSKPFLLALVVSRPPMDLLFMDSIPSSCREDIKDASEREIHVTKS